MLLLSLLLAAAPAQDVPAPSAPPENLLRGPARCVLRYLEAVRVAGPRAAEVRARPTAVRVGDWDAVRRLIAPRTLDEIGRGAQDAHPLAPWVESAWRVLETFQLLAVRRAPLGAAVVTVRELFWLRREPGAPLGQAVSEYLVARVGGEWRVVARKPGGAFDDEEVQARYAARFDAQDRTSGLLDAGETSPPAQGAAPVGVPR
jgi:CelD/BcsL family acetyltransferase involved in cellulose biosynthesis